MLGREREGEIDCDAGGAEASFRLQTANTVPRLASPCPRRIAEPVDRGGQVLWVRRVNEELV